MYVREYGTSGPVVVVLHGGPAAVGEAAPIARGLAGSYRVLEPWQRGSSDTPLSVARHIADLHELVTTRCSESLPALVGESWGAMLALAYAAAHPNSSGPIVLVGCGTFDKEARARMRRTLEERTDDELHRRLASLQQAFTDPDERLKRTYELTKGLYQVDPLEVEENHVEGDQFDVRAHIETWQDMVRLQEEGVFPAAFAAIQTPVLMLHGAEDPHPGQMIRTSLQPYLPQLEYHQWEHCGHSPWLERTVRDDFFAVMDRWLTRHLAGAP